ncbi:MAG: hypothetical protein EOP42_07935 [Sphingobacteriaceae bacterium]|nr:MAG: hypothetical protein EOP42_07935 [Sphingobacteriaceae bacterium]
MINGLPDYISLIFGLTTLATLFLFCWTVKKSSLKSTNSKTSKIFAALTLWLMLQAILSLNIFYSANTNVLPPKIAVFGILPTVLIILFLFNTISGKCFIDSLPLINLTYTNLVRIPVELTLYLLCLNKAVPEIMTFTGYNFDIIAGLTAPFIAFSGITKQKIDTKFILIWNFISLGLLTNIVTIAILSAPFPLQKLAFNQPNIAILNFPFSWLPTFIVPIVLFGHLVSIRQLSVKKQY